MDIINCPSCGASNQMPEGKNSMFCAFCGNAIKAVEKDNKLFSQSSIITKPEISKKKIGKGAEYVAKFKFDKYNNLKNKGKVIDTEIVLDEGGELSLIDRNIKSLDEITVWFSDNELSEIQTLTLDKNKIISLKGIERFQALKTLNINDNEIFELPKENSFLKNLFRIYLIGNPIEKRITQAELNYYSNIRFYKSTIKKIAPSPNVVGDMELSCKNLNINTVEEIADLYSTDEVNDIKILNFSNNKIKSLKGLSKFTSNTIDFSNNDLKLVDDLPKFKNEYLYSRTYIELKFNNNKNLREFTDKAIKYFYDKKNPNVKIFLWGCDNFDYESLSKINYNQIVTKSNCESSIFEIIVDKNVKMPRSLNQIGFVNKDSYWGLGDGYKKTGCFIATATMGSYNHPLVMELRNLRDNWILKQSWGNSFVKWYYINGAIAAKFIEKSNVLKKLSYIFIVKPLVYLARIIQKK